MLWWRFHPQATAEANNLTAVAEAKEVYTTLMEEVCGGAKPYLQTQLLEAEHCRIRFVAFWSYGTFFFFQHLFSPFTVSFLYSSLSAAIRNNYWRNICSIYVNFRMFRSHHFFLRLVTVTETQFFVWTTKFAYQKFKSIQNSSNKLSNFRDKALHAFHSKRKMGGEEFSQSYCEQLTQVNFFKQL